MSVRTRQENHQLEHIIEQFDEILSGDETNLSTRTGLRLAMSVLREAVAVLADYEDYKGRVDTIVREREEEKKKRDRMYQIVVGAAGATIVMLIINGFLFLLGTSPLIQHLIKP